MFKGNRIYKIDKNGKKKRIFFNKSIRGLRIKFDGKNNTVVLKEPLPEFKHSKIICANNCYIEINPSKYNVKGLKIISLVSDSTCIIKENFSSANNCHIMFTGESGRTVNIGEDCMFATNVLIRVSDAHAILDKNGNTINYGGDVNIGNHVWLAYSSTVLKGVTIPDNCVIGSHSLVTKSCDESNAIYAGVPAKKIKTEVLWQRKPPQR